MSFMFIILNAKKSDPEQSSQSGDYVVSVPIFHHVVVSFPDRRLRPADMGEVRGAARDQGKSRSSSLCDLC